MTHYRLFTLLVLSILIISCKITDKNKEIPITVDMIDLDNPPTMRFDVNEYNFDTISIGSSISYSFKFTNNSNSPLLIHSVKAACGCTILKDWPKTPIAPDGIGEIPIEFTPKAIGKQKKYISIIANTRPATTKLYLVGEVIGV